MSRSDTCCYKQTDLNAANEMKILILYADQQIDAALLKKEYRKKEISGSLRGFHIKTSSAKISMPTFEEFAHYILPPCGDIGNKTLIF
ncbi:hypothetical protein HanIR_Chr03g0108651 [Helianthus annuus]|nr:hypothetical protein HanIR_Chr03g0108651 [Helianthus annuus]